MHRRVRAEETTVLILNVLLLNDFVILHPHNIVDLQSVHGIAMGRRRPEPAQLISVPAQLKAVLKYFTYFAYVINPLSNVKKWQTCTLISVSYMDMHCND